MIGATAVLLLAAVPLLSMRLGQTDAGTNPPSTTTRKAYDLTADAFGPGFNGPLLLSIELTGDAAADTAALDALASGLAADPAVAVAAPAQINDAGDAAIVTVIPTDAPQDEATTELVHRLRDDVVPQALEGTGTTAYVGGLTAVFIDLSDKVASRLPLFVGAVVGLSFLLLMVVFRSVLVPLKAALMNLLSIGAAYGVVVAVFQWGWGKSLIGLDETVPIVSFVPMFMFAVLFGLSMDYEVFLLSRIREEHLDGRDNRTSVINGISSTARVITSAALDHDLRVRRLRARAPADREDVRRRPGHRGARGRHHRARDPRARRRCACSATPTGGCRAGSTACCPASTSRARAACPRPSCARCPRPPRRRGAADDRTPVTVG